MNILMVISKFFMVVPIRGRREGGQGEIARPPLPECDTVVRAKISRPITLRNTHLLRLFITSCFSLQQVLKPCAE